MSVMEEVLAKHVCKIQQVILYQFANECLLKQALTHKSYTNENSQPYEDNERLEFLGDSVLGLIVSEYLFRTFPGMREGELSRARAHIVRAVSLAQVGRELDLGKMILLGRGEDSTGGRLKASVVANAVEALFGAVFVDGGMAATETVIRRMLGDRLSLSPEELTQLDPKGRLQEMMQERKISAPNYLLVELSGPEHDRRFEVEVLVAGVALARSVGRSKKEAASAAAVLAMEKLLEGSVAWPVASEEETNP